MGFLKRLFFRKRNVYEEIKQEEEAGSREVMDVSDSEQRGQYVDSCLEQMSDAARELEILSEEYQLVTTYLTDMEEIEALPKEEQQRVQASAKHIVELTKEREQYRNKADRMREDDYRRMNRLEDEVQTGYQKLKEAEKYQGLVKKDLQKLESEKSAYYYRKGELSATIENTRGMANICMIAVVLCVLMLVVLQFTFSLDVQVGYLLTALAAAVAVTIIYLKHSDAKREIVRVKKAINRLVILQNKVKIRYVNNTNLLDYLYLKFGVDNAEALKRMWEAYVREKEEREKMNQTEEDLDYYRSELLKHLYRFNIKVPDIWPGQAAALLDSREMVEIRHGLILRRQSLRKQMDYNKELAGKAQEIIKQLVKDYPQYAPEILEKVSSIH